MPPHAVAHTLLGNVQGFLMYAACPPPALCPAAAAWRPFAPGEAADLLATILFDGLLADGERPAPS